MKARVVDRLPDPQARIDEEEAVAAYKKFGHVATAARALGIGTHAVRTALRNNRIELRNDGTRDPKVRGLYVAWRQMILRCDDPSHKSYRHYGARSIGYAKEWRAFPTFRTWALEHGWKDGFSLLLIDTEKDHGPINCRWGTRSEMLEHRSRRGPMCKDPVLAFGELKSAWAWARDPRCRVSHMGLVTRLRRGWHPEEAMTVTTRTAKPTRTAPKRKVTRMETRIDWDRAIELYRSNTAVPQIAAMLACASSSLYLGLLARGVYTPAKARKKTASDRRLYESWTRMRRTCQGSDTGRRDKRIPLMHEEWSDFWVFRDWAKAQGYKPGLCLVRVDADRPFDPANCRFVPRGDFALYSRTPPLPMSHPLYLLRALGEVKSIPDWAKDPRCPVTVVTIRRRLRAGWTPADAVTATPAKLGMTGFATHEVTAFGQTKGITEWSRDRRCKVSVTGLMQRLQRGVAPEVAITAKPFERGRLRAAAINPGIHAEVRRAVGQK